MMVAAQSAEYLLLEARLPGKTAVNIGVILIDAATDRVYIRLRRDFSTFADEVDAEILEMTQRDLERKAGEMGGSQLVGWMEDTLSGFLTITDREALKVEDFPTTLRQLYREHIPAEVLKFKTHLPRFTLKAAAGRFGEQREGEVSDWEEIAPGLRLTEDMFVSTVFGRSMEPMIPDGSDCIFRYGVAGSRHGRLVLVENFADIAGVSQYTIKRYRSEKRRTEDGTWSHKWIRLEPLNSEFEAWELEEGRQFRVIAEFLRLLHKVTPPF